MKEYRNIHTQYLENQQKTAKLAGLEEQTRLRLTYQIDDALGVVDGSIHLSQEEYKRLLIDPESGIAGFYIVKLRLVPTLDTAIQADVNDKVYGAVGLPEEIRTLKARGVDTSKQTHQIINRQTQRLAIPIWLTEDTESGSLMTSQDNKINIVPPQQEAARTIDQRCALLLTIANSINTGKSVLFRISRLGSYWEKSHDNRYIRLLELDSDEPDNPKYELLYDIRERYKDHRREDVGLHEFINFIQVLSIRMTSEMERHIDQFSDPQSTKRFVKAGTVIWRNPETDERRRQEINAITPPNSLEFDAFATRLAVAFPELRILPPQRDGAKPGQAAKNLVRIIQQTALLLEGDRLYPERTRVELRGYSLVLDGTPFINVAQTNVFEKLNSVRKRRVKNAIQAATEGRVVTPEVNLKK